MSANKTVSKKGTEESKPIRKFEIKEQNILPFLKPFSIKKIPTVENVTYQLISRLDVRTETLFVMPVDVLAYASWEKRKRSMEEINEIDNVFRHLERKSISTEDSCFQNTT